MIAGITLPRRHSIPVCWGRLLHALVVSALFSGAGSSRLVAQITPGEYAARRDSLAGRIDSGVVIAFGERAPVSDFGPFYQIPAFHYLTGYDYADATLVLVVRGGKPTGTLFVTRSTPRRALYYGDEPDSTAIARETGLASRLPSTLIPTLDSLALTSLPFYSLRDFEDADFAAADSLTRGGQLMKTLAAGHPGLVIKDAYPIVDQLRARKSPAELALLRKAAGVSSEGHRTIMRNIAPGMHEYDAQAFLECTIRRLGAERPSYGSIVGSGPNGTQLHYMKDRRLMQSGEVVVIDAAAEYQGYAADITRTLPVNGTYSPRQRAIYQLVLEAQAAAERNSGPGQSMTAASDSSFDVRARGLAALGLIESPTAGFDPPWPANCDRNPRACSQASLFAIHGISHGLGLAVHDPAQGYFGDRVFKEGDAFTIEPGLYFSEKLLDILPDTPRNRAFIAKVRPVVQQYADMGVRIEDDYIITERGLERISLVPREIGEIETLMKQRPASTCPGEETTHP